MTCLNRISLLSLKSYFIFQQILLINAHVYWEKIFDNLSHQSNEKPAPRRDSAIGYDIDRNRLIIFGGIQSHTKTNDPKLPYTIPVIFDDTWEYNLDKSSFFFLNFKHYYKLSYK